MKTNEYGKYLSEAYDILETDVDYDAWADFYLACAKKYMGKKPAHVCDMACGTGKLSVALDKRGCKVTAFDLSEEMLALADKRAYDEKAQNVRFTRQDLRDFRVYTPAELCVCMMDGINCLSKPSDVSCAFESAHRALCRDGLFIFDVNSRYKFENIYGENAYLLENENVFLAWQNFYDADRKTCKMDLTFFIEGNDGKYQRFEESVCERMYPIKTLDRLLKNAGFEIACRSSSFDFAEADEASCDRIFYICQKKAE